MRRRRDTADHLLLARRVVASGCLDSLCWRGLCFRIFLTCRDSLVLAGARFWHFLFFWLLGPCSREAEKQAKVLPGRLQMKRPRPQKSAPGGSKIEPRGPPGGLWGPLGRQLGARWPPRPLWRRSWALGPLLAPLWAVLALPGGPREAPGKGSGSSFWCFFGWSSARS